MAHYFINDNNLKSSIKMIKTTIRNKQYTFYTDSGVFSRKEIDFGTRILIESLPLDRFNGKTLDMGCGYGPIGIFIADNTTAEVHMVDINLKALDLVRQNVELNKIKNVKIYESNIYQNVTEKFDFIISNPPIRAGKEVVYKIIFEAKNYLNNDGELWLVIRKKQGAKSLLKDLEQDYITKIIKRNNGFFVVSAKIR